MSARNPFSIKNWAREWALAREILKEEPGMFAKVEKGYIIFKFNGPKFVLVFYPHKTSANNHHMRVRLESAKPGGRLAAAECMWKLTSAEHTCTFNVNNVHSTWGHEAFVEAIVRGGR